MYDRARVGRVQKLQKRTGDSSNALAVIDYKAAVSTGQTKMTPTC
jgi:hypothetical protein